MADSKLEILEDFEEKFFKYNIVGDYKKYPLYCSENLYCGEEVIITEGEDDAIY